MSASSGQRRGGGTDPNITNKYSLGAGLWNFLQSFWQLNHNFLMASIVKNPMFIRGRGDNGRIDNKMVDEPVIGRQCFEQHKEAWLKLRLMDTF